MQEANQCFRKTLDETPACVKAVGCKQFEADRDESEGGCGAPSRVPGHADGAPCPSARVATPLKRGNGLPRKAWKAYPDKRPLIFGKDRLIHGPKKPPTKRVEAD